MVSFPQAEQSKSHLTEKALSLISCMVLHCSTVLFSELLDVGYILSGFLILKASTVINLHPLRRVTTKFFSALVLCPHFVLSKVVFRKPECSNYCSQE